MSEASKLWVVVPAAGVGRRFGADQPKQYLPLAGRPVAEWTLERLLQVDGVQQVVVAISSEDQWWQQLTISDSRVNTVTGGAERADSVRLALESLADSAAEQDWVLVHDIARPCVRVADIERLVATLESHPVGGILATPMADTVKRVGQKSAITNTEDRQQLWAALTPQMFRYGTLRQALAEAVSSGQQPTDEAAAIEALGHQALVVEGQRDNLKITRPEDLVIAEAIIRYQNNNNEQ